MTTETTALRELLARATPGPWEQDSVHDPDAEYGSGPDPDSGFRDYEILGADGLKILGTENAAHKEIEVECDEEGDVYAWDRVGRANVALIVAALNALPTMLDEIDALRAQVERLTVDEKAHSCHMHCERPICVLTRKNEALRERLVEAERRGIERAAKVAEKWESSLKPGSLDRAHGHAEAASDIAYAIRALAVDGKNAAK